MRFRLLVASLAVPAALALGWLPAAAQVGPPAPSTTTTVAVKPIPVTGSSTPTTAPASTSTSGTTATAAPSGNLATTGIAADTLVPFGFLLIGVGAVLEALARRPREQLDLF